MSSRPRKVLTRFDDYREMMDDRVRLDAYAQAIAETVREGDVVLDLGAGLGILSLLAARAGARRVYAVEMGYAASLARRIVADNGLSGRIEILEAHSLDVELPERADVLVSETLGSFALEESTLAFTIDARRRLLREDARMVPRRLQPWLAPVELPGEHAKADFWSEVAGFDFSAARDELLGRMSLADVTPPELMSRPQPFAALDLRTVTRAAVSGRHLFTLRRSGTVHGVAGWFVAELADDIFLSNAPGGPPTHWRQAFFPFREPVSVVAGDVMEVTLAIEPASERSDDSVVRYDYRCTQLKGDG